ncbi:F-box/LRR-repeat protein 20 [Anabrus simplex]|uniref:F-box/LRR-repeat protein 20 n=1 Tax=Anabrus simplex TaxID=316456 RepID=UPI0035A28CE4
MESNSDPLPADVLLEIFSYCSYTDLVRLQFVCKLWQQVSREKRLWKNVVYRPDCIDTPKDIIDSLNVSPELRALDLRDISCTITKELVEVLVNGCPRLEQLRVDWNFLYRKINLEIKTIKILILKADRSFALKFDFEYLHNYLPNVEHLDCRVLNIRESDLRVYLWKKRLSLHTVGFSCRMLHSNCILSYLKVCTKLKSLTLFGLCSQIGHLSVQSLGHLKQISSLTVRSSGWSSVHDYLAMFSYFPNLVELQLDTVTVHDENMLLVVAEKCPLLQKLTLYSLRGYFRDHNLKYVSNFKKLMFLCLRSNCDITDASVAHLQAISELRYLDILDCERMTPQCLLTLCGFDKLQTLKFDLKKCDLPTDFGAGHVQNPDLHIMFYNCKDTSVLDHLRRQRLRISLLNGSSLRE